MDVSRSRIEGLLAAFPKLIDSEGQHTFVETDAVRCVCLRVCADVTLCHPLCHHSLRVLPHPLPRASVSRPLLPSSLPSRSASRAILLSPNLLCSPLVPPRSLAVVVFLFWHEYHSVVPLPFLHSHTNCLLSHTASSACVRRCGAVLLPLVGMNSPLLLHSHTNCRLTLRLPLVCVVVVQVRVPADGEPVHGAHHHEELEHP
jgi:hypothetical protein